MLHYIEIISSYVKPSIFTLPIMLGNKGGPYATVVGTISVQKRFSLGTYTRIQTVKGRIYSFSRKLSMHGSGGNIANRKGK